MKYIRYIIFLFLILTGGNILFAQNKISISINSGFGINFSKPINDVIPGEGIYCDENSIIDFNIGRCKDCFDKYDLDIQYKFKSKSSWWLGSELRLITSNLIDINSGLQINYLNYHITNNTKIIIDNTNRIDDPIQLAAFNIPRARKIIVGNKPQIFNSEIIHKLLILEIPIGVVFKNLINNFNFEMGIFINKSVWSKNNLQEEESKLIKNTTSTILDIEEWRSRKKIDKINIGINLGVEYRATKLIGLRLFSKHPLGFKNNSSIEKLYNPISHGRSLNFLIRYYLI